mmetsp:Transcript_13273/g.26962  ORF Transcript_13273/g.26962 Transcript_13273/m.26962 type:complete len:111 (+) Transcript_13273:175-507(+)
MWSLNRRAASRSHSNEKKLGQTWLQNKQRIYMDFKVQLASHCSGRISDGSGSSTSPQDWRRSYDSDASSAMLISIPGGMEWLCESPIDPLRRTTQRRGNSIYKMDFCRFW